MQLSSKSETYLNRIIQVVYYAMIALGFYLFMTYALWLVFPFLFSFFVAMLLQKPMNYANRKIRLKKNFSAVALVLLLCVLFFGVLGYICVKLFGAVRGFVTYLGAQNPIEVITDVAERIPDMLSFLPGRLHDGVTGAVAEFIEKLQTGESTGIWEMIKENIKLEWFTAPVSGLLSTVSRIPAILLAVVITVIASFFMTLTYDSIVTFIKRQLKPAGQKTISAVKRIFVDSLGKYIRSYVLIMSVTFAELMLGLGLLLLIGVGGVFDSKYLLPIALATTVVDILPVLGTGTVLVPWALYHLIMQNYGMGVGLIVVYVVILVIRQVLEPKVLASNLGLPPIVTLAAIYFGLQLFGFIGLLVMPILLIVIKLLNDEGVIHVWNTLPAGGDGTGIPRRHPVANRPARAVNVKAKKDAVAKEAEEGEK